MTRPDGPLCCEKIHGLVTSGLAPLFLDMSEWAPWFLHGPSHVQSRRLLLTIAIEKYESASAVSTPVQNKAGVEQAGVEQAGGEWR